MWHFREGCEILILISVAYFYVYSPFHLGFLLGVSCHDTLDATYQTMCRGVLLLILFLLSS